MGWHAPGCRVATLLVVAAIVAGCGGAGGSAAPGDGTSGASSSRPTSAPASPAPAPTATPSPVPTAVPSPPTAAELVRFDAAARAFVDRFNADWADATAAFAPFTPDAVVIDPTNMDYTIGPGPDVPSAWGAFARAYPAYRATTTAAFVSDVVAAVTTEVAGLPVDLPDGLLHELRVFRFTDGSAAAATAMELWYELGDRLADPANTRLDCVAPDRCADDVAAYAEAYLAAWTSGDAQAIGRLYGDAATLIDGARGIRATGASAIGGLADQRFAGAVAVCEVRDLFIQLDGGDPRTSDNVDPRGGSVAGIAILHRCELGTSAEERPLDALATLLFGTRQARSFDNDPDGRIVSEEVLYDAAGLTAAGLLP